MGFFVELASAHPVALSPADDLPVFSMADGSGFDAHSYLANILLTFLAKVGPTVRGTRPRRRFLLLRLAAKCLIRPARRTTRPPLVSLKRLATDFLVFNLIFGFFFFIYFDDFFWSDVYPH